MSGVVVLALLANAVLWCVPLFKLMPRAGLDPRLALAAAVPVVGTILLWVVALKRWPGDDVRA